MATKEPIAKAPARRVRRTPIGKRNVLTVSGKEPGYQYRVVNDESDRVQEFLDNGWELVERDTVRIGDKRLNSASPEGTVAMASVGQGMKAYVMRIRDEYYQEDQAAKQEYVDQTEASMKSKATSEGNYGKIEITRS